MRDNVNLSVSDDAEKKEKAKEIIEKLRASGKEGWKDYYKAALAIIEGPNIFIDDEWGINYLLENGENSVWHVFEYGTHDP